MKYMGGLRMWAMFVVALGATLIFAPASRAQAEVAPDHYDEAPAAAPARHTASASQPKAAPVQSGTASKENETTAQTPVAGHNALVSQKRDAAATEPKR